MCLQQQAFIHKIKGMPDENLHDLSYKLNEIIADMKGNKTGKRIVKYLRQQMRAITRERQNRLV